MLAALQSRVRILTYVGGRTGAEELSKSRKKLLATTYKPSFTSRYFLCLLRSGGTYCLSGENRCSWPNAKRRTRMGRHVLSPLEMLGLDEFGRRQSGLGIFGQGILLT